MNSQPLQNLSPVAVIKKFRAHHRRDDNDHRPDQRLPFTQHQPGPGSGANKLAGHQTIRDAILDQKIRAVVQGAMEESGAVLIKRYAFDPQKHAAYIQKILGRFENPYLKDDVERVGRQPLRKLSAGDRLIKPLLGTLEYGLPHRNLVKGIAAAMHFRSEDDPQAQELAALIADKGPQAALAQISGLDAASDVVAEAVNDYNAEK